MSLSDHWLLDPDVTFLNHGSFGACPRAVLDHQQGLRERMERDPVSFFAVDYDGLLAEAVAASAAFVGADPAGYAFVPNATTGVNVLLRSLPLDEGDEVLVTDHEYEACALALEAVAAETGAIVRTVRIPPPVEGPEAVTGAILDAVTAATRFALLDHVTSATALILPVEEIVAGLAEQGVATIVDGAHAPGMVPVNITSLGCAAYAGNWHKWVCAPKGSGFIWVADTWRDRARPLVVSHGAGHPKEGQTPFRARFDWTGTHDPTAFLTVPHAIEVIGSMVPGGWDEVRRLNRETILAMRRRIVEKTGLQPAGPEEMIGSMAAFAIGPPAPDPFGRARPLLKRFAQEYGVILGVSATRSTPRLQVRVSAHLHTDASMVEPLLEALADMGEIKT
ncbi:MAG TPA: aminotransferase class V-fold PLP-dependent enzyme [Acidimicrobiia bacterium]|nr:aminotransferase class V-fold PLP-dependent enzyme [Acidimicrobiia bacterium]